MPDIDKLVQISLDDSKIVDNTTSTFIYFTYPNTDCKFTSMVTENDGTYKNVLNYQFPSNITNIYVSQNKNFTDLDEYSATSFSITQKIHKTTRITKGTSGDLELIIQHIPNKKDAPNNYAPKDAKLFLILYLTPDSSSTSGGDINTIFNKIKPDSAITQTNNFETANLSSPILSISLDSAIQGQFGKDPLNKTSQPSNMCFMYIDNNKNPVVIMQNPIPISSSNFQTIQQFMTFSKKQIDTSSIFNGVTDLTPIADPNTITTNILMKSKNDLANDVKENPKTPTQQKDANKDQKVQTQASAAEKTNSENFTVIEGLKNIRCRPSDSNVNSSSQLVTSKDPMSSSAAMQFLINAILFIGITLGMYMFAPGMYASLAAFNDEKAWMGIPFAILGTVQNNFDERVARISFIYWIIGIISVILFIILWSVGLTNNPGKKKIPDRDRNFMIVFGFLFLSICILNAAFLKMTNESQQLSKLVALNIDEGLAVDKDVIKKSLDGVFKDTSVYWFYSKKT
jgi:hypothetical protein